MIAKMIRDGFLSRTKEVEQPVKGIAIVGMKPDPEDFEDLEPDVVGQNLDIKTRLRQHIAELESRAQVRAKGMRISIAEAEAKRVEQEVAELLADEQRKEKMGGWA